MSFSATREALPVDDYIFLHYQFETATDPETAALHLCQESSTAQWCRPGHDEDFRPRHGARLVGLQVGGETDTPSWSSPFLPPGPYRHVHAILAQPVINFGPRLPNMLTAALGEGIFHVPGIATIKLVDMELPDSFLAWFDGPRFGIEGLRERLGVFDRPLFIGVVKPNVGLPPADFAALAEAAWRGGLDIAKDDELLSDVAYSPLRERLQLCLEALRRVPGSGRLFLANITDEVENLLPLHDAVHALGGDRVALMLNAEPVGLSACRMVARHTRVPLFSHFDMQAAFTRMPFFGVSAVVWTSLLRLAGFDAIIMPGPGPRMLTAVEEIQACVQACTRRWGKLRPSLPVPGGSDWAGTLDRMLEVVGHRDFGFIPGRGVFAHPHGPQAGATSLHQAWEAWVRGVPLADHARHHPELAAAMACFS